ncbi:hypothetical protein DFAR_3000018 [Desulfarculales bacterium]
MLAGRGVQAQPLQGMQVLSGQGAQGAPTLAQLQNLVALAACPPAYACPFPPPRGLRAGCARQRCVDAGTSLLASLSSKNIYYSITHARGFLKAMGRNVLLIVEARPCPRTRIRVEYGNYSMSAENFVIVQAGDRVRLPSGRGNVIL